MAADYDWRLQGQETYLAGRKLRRCPWSPYREGWDHDHCAFCSREIVVPAVEPGSVEVAYVTVDDNYHWVCDDCFADFRDRFNWSVADGE